MDMPISRGTIQGSERPWQPLPYSPKTLTPGVVSLGFGNFTRAFVLRFLNDLAKQGHQDVGVIGVARSDREQQVFNRLTEQRFNYHLIERCAEETIERIGVLRGIMVGEKDPAAVADRIAHPNTKLVTMTVTKDAYKLDETTKADAAAIKQGDYGFVSTIVGWLVSGLHQRYTAGQEPPTVLSFDNLTANGDLVKKVAVGMAAMVDPAFGAFVENKVVFPNTVVDRLAPKQNYHDNEAHMASRYKIRDAAAFVCEGGPPLLVIEKTMNGLFPPFQDVGAKLVERTDAYAELKLRGLNGYHKVVGMVGMVLGIDQVHEVMEDKSVRPFMLKLMDQAMSGLNTKPENTDLGEHNRVTLARLDNHLLPDQTSRLVRDTWSSVPERIVNAPAIERGVSSDASAFAAAIWLRYMKGHDDSGNVYQLTKGDITDDKGPRMKTLGLTTEASILKNLGKHLSGSDQVSPKMQAFVDLVVDYSRLINDGGLRSALELVFPAKDASHALKAAPARPFGDCEGPGAHIGKATPQPTPFTPAK